VCAELAASQQSDPKLCQCQCHLNVTNTQSVPPTADSGYNSSLSNGTTTLATPCCNTVTVPSNVATTPNNSVVMSENTPSDQKLSVPPGQWDSSVVCYEQSNTDLCCKAAATSEDEPTVKCEGEATKQQTVAASISLIDDDDDDFKKPKKKLRRTGVS